VRNGIYIEEYTGSLAGLQRIAPMVRRWRSPGLIRRSVSTVAINAATIVFASGVGSVLIARAAAARLDRGGSTGYIPGPAADRRKR